MKSPVSTLISIGILATSVAASQCTLSVQTGAGTQSIDFDRPGSVTNCRTVADAKMLSVSTANADITFECFSEFGCAGYAYPMNSANALKQTFAKSCRIISECGANVKNVTVSTYAQVTGLDAHLVVTYNASSGLNSTSTANDLPVNRMHSAVLAEGIEMAGMKHWIDGKMGECRGLDTVINSVQMLSAPGGDPEYSAVDDTVTLAFFDQFGCDGNMVGAVTGSTKDTSAYFSGKPLSVRFVASGLDNQFFAKEYSGIDGSPNSGAFATSGASMALASLSLFLLFL